VQESARKGYKKCKNVSTGAKNYWIGSTSAVKVAISDIRGVYVKICKNMLRLEDAKTSARRC
jgi:hypothetical protein